MKTNKEPTKLERAIELVKMLPEYKEGEKFKFDGWYILIMEVKDFGDLDFENPEMHSILNVSSSSIGSDLIVIEKDTFERKTCDSILTSLIADLERHFRTIENKYPMFNITELRREDGEEVGHGSNIFIKTEEIFRSELTGKWYKLVEVGGGE